MVSKSLCIARRLLICLALAGCTSTRPWNSQPPPEVNLAFTVENNLLFLTTARINGRPGRYFLGSASAHTVVDSQFARAVATSRYALNLNEKVAVGLTPVILPLTGLGDAMIGADAWSHHALTIDYRSGLVSYQKEGIHPGYMSLFDYDGDPAIMVEVNGRSIAAVVDTAVPDSLVLPGAEGRRSAHVVIAGNDLGDVDIAQARIARARIGNRLLSKFLVTIDYGRQQVGLWRDPRIPL